MSKQLIPLRPDNASTPLSQPEQAALTWYVLSGCTKKEAFITFARPDMLDSKAKAAVEDYVKQFYARKEVKDYIEAYQATLDAFLHPTAKKTDQPVGSLEERKAKAKTKLVEFAMSLADNIEQAEDPEFVLKMADKAGLLDGDEQVEEQPRRYLPTSCLGECRYRAFCENPDNVEDLCRYCKYHQFGEENGVHYDSEHQLSLPAGSGTEVAEEK
jgi:hypothetical protein